VIAADAPDPMAEENWGLELVCTMLDFFGDYVDSLRSLWIFSPRFYCWWPNSVLARAITPKAGFSEQKG
jgi:hypothetical protein